MKNIYFAHPVSIFIKRAIDIIVSIIALLITLPIIPLIALAIKVDTKGAVFYRQMRVGMQTTNFVYIFYMIKFRSMKSDAEKETGAVWATEGDARITKVGNFLRRTRLDEIPQLWNVLRGEMSIVGPRPERPCMYMDIERQIPMYKERTYGLKPGITGFAQVNLGYDGSIEDVRIKVGYDHAYALSLSDPIQCLKMDIEIMFKTILTMVLKKGQ